jgi:hypothetical protein
MNRPTQDRAMHRATRPEHNEFRVRVFMSVSLAPDLSSVSLRQLGGINTRGRMFKPIRCHTLQRELQRIAEVDAPKPRDFGLRLDA